MSDAWDGTCGFHNIDRDEAPLGHVAFRTNEAELVASARDLEQLAEEADDGEVADRLLGTAAWYTDLALDLAEIRAQPEISARNILL